MGRCRYANAIAPLYASGGVIRPPVKGTVDPIRLSRRCLAVSFPYGHRDSRDCLPRAASDRPAL
ncbi:MAG: hypothetical protein AAF289_00055 [Cyanobacteria bacterium P01_A01_bin.135]